MSEPAFHLSLLFLALSLPHALQFDCLFSFKCRHVFSLFMSFSFFASRLHCIQPVSSTSPFLIPTFQQCQSALSLGPLWTSSSGIHLSFSAFTVSVSVTFLDVFIHVSFLHGFFGRPLRGRFSTVLLRRYLTMMLCTVDLGILSSCPMAPSDLPSFQRSTTRCRCTTSCSLVFWQAAFGPPAAPQAAPPVAPAAAAASVGADKRQTVVETRRGEQDNVTRYWSPKGISLLVRLPPFQCGEVRGQWGSYRSWRSFSVLLKDTSAGRALAVAGARTSEFHLQGKSA